MTGVFPMKRLLCAGDTLNIVFTADAVNATFVKRRRWLPDIVIEARQVDDLRVVPQRYEFKVLDVRDGTVSVEVVEHGADAA